MALRFFLGANSKDGFQSYFPYLSADEEHKLYLLKGGPGCGKSTCMRFLAEKLGGAEEEIACTSDPDSLDGVILGDAAVLDATAPHALEPEFPGCGGDYLFLPPLKNTRALGEKREALRALREEGRRHYAGAQRLLQAIWLLREQQRALVSPLISEEKLRRRALALLRREVPVLEKPGQLRLRFLNGITPRGEVFFAETVAVCADRIIDVQDRLGLALPLLEALRDGALARGQTVYACLDPLEPERTLHLLLPEARLAFISTRGRDTGLALARAVRVNAMPEGDALRALRPQLRLLDKTGQTLLQEAVDCLSACHETHDRIEEIYRPHLDPEALAPHMDALLRILRQEG